MQPSLTFQGAYSIGQSQRSEWWQNHTGQNPAPSSYNLPNFHDKPKQPDTKIGNGDRSTYGNIIDVRGYPEVGKYKIKPTFAQNQQKMKFSKASRSYTTDVPPASKMGPAQFKPCDKSAKKNLPQYSFGYRFLEKPINEIPSPDTYPRQEIIEFKQSRTQNSWKHVKDEKEGFLVSQERFKKVQIYPGVGEYVITDVNMIHGPQNKFTNSEKLPQTSFNNQNYPGPGAFDPKQTWCRSSGISLSQKFGSAFVVPETDFPGPGQYQPQQVKSRQNIKFGTDKNREMVLREDTYKPGPWRYDNQISKKQESFLHADSFDMSLRKPLAKIDECPGAGTYYPNEYARDGLSYSMAAKLKEKKFQQYSYPGPSTYDPSVEQIKQSSQAVSVKTGQRTNFVYSKHPANGPGAYKLNSSAKDKQPVKFSIGTQERFRTRSQYEPGPGSYNIGGTIGNVPDYLKLQKLQIEKSEEIK